MKYAFEKYEFNNRGRIFLGYLTVEANSNEDAFSIAREKVDSTITLAQIYIPQNV